MDLGNSLFNARKKSGFSQEDIAGKLGVSRQTVSKWETGETLPDIRQAKRMACLYHLSLDDLIEFDIDISDIEQVIENVSEEKQKSINWTDVWGKKYPVLTTYQQNVNIKKYSGKLKELLGSLQREYGYNDVDALLAVSYKRQHY